MRNFRLKIVALFVLIFTGLLITSCNKDEDFTDNTNIEMITQRFGLDILSTDLLKNDWNVDMWNVDLSILEADLTFTGVGHSHTTSITTTIQQLSTEGGVYVDLVNGQQYDITFKTPHKRTSEAESNGASVWFDNSFDTPSAPGLAMEVDIEINTTELITGNSVELPATLDDLLIVVDIAGVNTVRVSNMSVEGLPDVSDEVIQLVRHNGNDGFQWGYFEMNDYERGNISGYDGLHLYVRGADHTLLHKIDASSFQKGKIYHIVEAGAINPFPLNIPDFDVIQIIL